MGKWHFRVSKFYKASRTIRNVTLYKINETQEISLHKAAADSRLEYLQIIFTQSNFVAIDEFDRRGLTPLHYAARKGDIECFQYLVSCGSCIFTETKISHSNILHSAALSGNQELLEYIFAIIKEQSDHETLIQQVCMTNAKGKLPAHCAAQSGSIACFKMLFNVNIELHKHYKPPSGRMYHHFAAERGNLELVEYLYREDIVIEFVTNLYHDIVHFAARSGSIQMLEYAIQKMPKMFRQSILSWTPLFAAASSFYTDVVKYLLDKHNLEVNCVSTTVSRTPLCCAAQSGSLKMLKFLISRGANLRPSYTKPLVHFAAQGGNVEMLKYLIDSCGLSDQLMIVSHIVGNYPKNIFHYAIESGDSEVLQFLHEEKILEYPKLGELLLSYRPSALEIACKCGNLSSVKYLINNRLFVSTNAEEVLIAAAENRFLDIVKVLLDTFYPIDDIHISELKRKVPSLLHILASWCNDIRFIEREIIDGRNFNVHGVYNDNTPLFEALRSANIPVTELLLQNKFLPSDSGLTRHLLHAAAMGGNLQLTKLLIEKIPLIIEQRTTCYHTKRFGYIPPLHLAVISRSLPLIKYFVEVLKVDINSESDTNLRALHLAASKNLIFTRSQPEIVEYLVLASGHPSLLRKVHTFPDIAGTDLTPHDVASNKEIRVLLEKYSPNLVAERLIVPADHIDIDYAKALGKGEGKFAPVYDAIYRYTPVAAKVFSCCGKDRSKVYTEFMREVGLMGSLRHRNLCLIEAAAIGKKTFILVSERMESSLKSYIESSSFISLQEIKKISIDICRGMIALHTNDPPILHRDLKAANILLDSRKNAKITDFGISKFAFIVKGAVFEDILPPGFDIQKQVFTVREDVYAFGLCLLTMVIRSVPDIFTFYLSHLHLYCCGEIADIIRKCCDTDPACRYQSFVEILEQFQLIEVFDDELDATTKSQTKGGDDCCSVVGENDELPDVGNNAYIEPDE